jgi:lipid-A-disaccharide synthase
LGEAAVPEYLQEDASPAALSKALARVIKSGDAREAQLSALARLDHVMQLPNGESPSTRAAHIILSHCQ